MGAGQAIGRSGGLSALLILLPAVAWAQVAPNQTTLFLHPTDVTDARALWVNPAGLGRIEEASVHLDVTVGDPGSAGRLRQLTLGFNSRGLSFGYQRDVFDGGVRGHTYRFGFAGGRERLAAGLAIALYRGDASSTGWNVGLVYDVAPALTIGGVIENLGRPTVRDSTLAVTYVPGATLHLFGPRAALSAHGRLTSDRVTGYAFGLRAGVGESTSRPLRLLVRLDTDHALRRAAFAFGLSLGGEDVVGAMARTPGDLGRLDALSLDGVSTRRFSRARGGAAP